MINAIPWSRRTGAPWRDLPERYGAWKTGDERLRRWTAYGTWDRILDDAAVKGGSVGAVAWTISVDFTHTRVRAHQHAARGPARGCPSAWTRDLAVDGDALGRSRGGLTSPPPAPPDVREPVRE